MLEIVLFIVGFILLIKASDYFVDASASLAKIFNVSEIIIGATIVSLGTTLPETLVSATGAIKGIGGIAYGNAVGSIICNTALIAALTMVCIPGKVNSKSLYTPTGFFFFAYAIYTFIAVYYRKFDRASGFILFCIFMLYVAATIVSAKNDAKKNLKSEKHASEEKKGNVFKEIIVIILSAIVIAIGSNLLVDNGTKIAMMLHVPDSVIAVTMVALGTSLPELMTAITAIRKNHSELSIGNIIGADFLNIVTVTGIAAMVGPFDIPKEKLIFGNNASFVIDIPLVFIVVSIMCIPALLKDRTFRAQGLLLLLIYVLYLVFQFVF